MRKKRKLVTLDMKIYIIPLLLISGFFFASGFFVFSTVKNHYYELRNGEAVKLAKSYANSVSKFTEGEELINELLEDKIRIAANSAKFFEEDLTNEMLIRLAETLEVDEVSIYHEESYLAYSNLPHLIGWTTYPGHPVDLFLKSGDEIFVGDIRQDVITGDYFKFGYLKLESGGLIQVGIRANDATSYFDRYHVRTLLDELKDNADALHIDILNHNLEVMASTDDVMDKTFTLDENALWEALAENRDFSYIYHTDDAYHYDVMVPLELDEESEFALLVGYSLKETTKSVRYFSFFGLGALGFIYALILYNMHATYQKNRSLHQTAYYDHLTGLPNKIHLEEYLHKKIAKGSGGISALMMINIQNFKQVNLTYGYLFGDVVIKAMADRLKSLENEENILFRFSVDRFALYHKEGHSVDELMGLAEKLSEAFKESLEVEGTQLYLSVKTGIVIIDDSYRDVNRIIKDASVALEEIRGKDISHILYDEKMFQNIQREDVLIKEMRAAIEEGDTECLYLEYQPVIEVKDESITGFEALARMNSRTYGRVSPLEFIEAAEKNMLIVDLGCFFLVQALKFIKELEKDGHGDMRVAVNISGIQLIQKEFTHSVLSLMKEYEVRSSQLELEITESILLDNYDMINKKLKILSDAGIRIALDDFGTGYSSFVRVQELHIDTLKIDRHFIGKLVDSRHDVITGDIIRMAHRYGLKVVAEGVENDIQKEYLLNHQCDYIQGYFYSPSVSKEKAKEMISKA